jgi:hypothetical protein
MRKGNQIKSDRSFVAGNAFGKAAPLVALGVATLFCFVGLAESSSTTPDDQGAGISRVAIEKFWTIYHGNDYAAIPDVQKWLKTAIQFDPDNPTLYALLGATHFWHVGEFTRDAKPQPSVLAHDMPTAKALFQKALDLDYYSSHPIGYINDDHLLAIWASPQSTRDNSTEIRVLSRKATSCSISPPISFQNSITSTAGPRTIPIPETVTATGRVSTLFGKQ